MDQAHHAIQAVARRTGLSAHVIRMWERRYGAIEPERSETKRRLYSEEQIERLMLLRQIIGAGHRIGHVARLPIGQLRQLASEATASDGGGGAIGKFGSSSSPFLDGALAAVKALNAGRLEEVLKVAETQLGGQGFLRQVAAPLAQAIGDLWREGVITAAHEHFASAVIRVTLGQATRSFAGRSGGPVLLVGTPAGQLHELGALLAGAAAANLGWEVIYLGASLPAAEIAGAARQNRARAVGLSLVYPEDDPRLEGELMRLRELLPQETVMLCGGRAVPSYREPLAKIGAILVKDLPEFCAALDGLRRTSRRSR